MMLGGWGRSPGSSGSQPPSGQRTGGHRLLPLPFNRSGGGGGGGGGGRAAEAEDVMGHYGRNSKGGVNKIRTGLYYSPPGTSYTILEKPPAAASPPPPPPPPPRATYLRESSAGVQSGPASHGPHPSHYHQVHGPGHGPVHGSGHPGCNNSGRPNCNAGARGGSASKKRPISPEQVLKMFAAPNFSPSSSYHVSKSQTPPPSSHHGGSNASSQPHSKSSSAIHSDHLTVRTISMSRPNVASGSPSGQGFGICVKGGADESNVGVYISRVEEGSIAENVGLKPGDSILEVNGRPFSSISHEEALKIFKSYRQITMTVKSPSPPQPMPAVHKKDDGENADQDDAWGGSSRTYSWINRNGQPVSPPLEYSKPISPYSKWSYTRSSKDKIRKVELVIEAGQSLGLMIRGGTEYNLGIFITGIDKDSVADRSGLMIGDQILEVNGQSFLNLSHDEAVNQLKFQKQMTLTVRDVGKVPHSCTTYSPETWDRSLDNADGALKLGTSAASQMVEEKARILLSKNEFNTLRYYLDEYSCSRMSIDAFIGILFELLNTTDKFTLLTELRELIGPSDRDRFDQLVYRRGRESRKTHSRNLDGFNTNVTGGQSKEFAFPNENSGMDVGTPEYSNSNYRPSSDCRNSDGKHSPMKTNEQCHRDNMEVEEFEYSHQDYGDLETELLPRKYHNDLIDVGYTHRNAGLYDESNMTRSSQLSNKHGRSYDGKNELLDENGSYRRESGFIEPSCSNAQNESQIMLDQQGNLRIIVKKIKPLLGIAIEGGINTKHLLPRIINIHENGAAYEAGGLEVGQLILEVDGQKVEGMPHQEVARLIAESFAQTDKSEIEFLVVEAKKSNLEPKPTALIFLES